MKRLLIEEGLDIKRELYLSLLVDRASAHVIFMASAAGGVEIEEVAKNWQLKRMAAACVFSRPVPPGRRSVGSRRPWLARPTAGW